MTIGKTSNMPLSRRRFIVLAGSAATVAAFAGLASEAEALVPVKWTGAALGAEATIMLYHSNPVWAREQLARCQLEIDRLENLFSLYRPNSAISNLNRNGHLINPEIEFVSLLSQAKAFSEQTNGLFDVSVQPLWKLYSDHFATSDADLNGPAKEDIKRVLKLVGSNNISLETQRIAFDKSGMAITLNGMAQGYITDQITSMLKSAGFEDVLVSLGENYALGAKPDGSPWKAGILSPADGQTIVKTVDLNNHALATSGGYGSPFSNNSPANHLLNPVTGGYAKLQQSVSVIADTALKADMVSTVLSLMNEDEARHFASSVAGIDSIIYG